MNFLPHSSAWCLECKKTVSQREHEMPPAWILARAEQVSRVEQGQKLYESGPQRQMAREVEYLLKSASEKVVLSSFLLADDKVEDALLGAARRGVRVYVLLASEARLGAETGEGEFDRRVFDQHKAMLARLGGYVLFRAASHFHAKIILIDPKSSPAGLLLTANLTKEAFERNQELAVRLTPDEVMEATAYLKWAMWEAAEHELITPGAFVPVKQLGKLKHPGVSKTIVATTAETNTIREEVMRLIAHATSQIMVSSFGWDERHKAVEALCARAAEGIDVTVLARPRLAAMPALYALAKAGAKVLGFDWLHAKAIWIDRDEALIMSANLETSGLDVGTELGVCLAGERARELKERLQIWQRAAPRHLLATPLLDDLGNDAKLWQNGRFQDVKIKDYAELRLGPVTAVSADRLKMAPSPALPADTKPQMNAREVRYSWEVRAPKLARNSKELERPADHAVPASFSERSGLRAADSTKLFQEPSGRIVVAVRRPSQLTLAREMMDEANAQAIVVYDDAW